MHGGHIIWPYRVEGVKVNFSLLSFEHHYLTHHLTSMHQLLQVFSKHSNLGK